MRPALTFSTRRARSATHSTTSTCLLKQCISTTRSTHPPLPAALWFLISRSMSTQTTTKEPKQHLHDKFHPRTMNKTVDLDTLLTFLPTSLLSTKDKFKSLRAALYNTTQHDARKVWLIYQHMVHYGADRYLKQNHYGFILSILKYGDAIPHMLTVLENMRKWDPQQDTHYHVSQVLFAMSRQGLVKEACQLVKSTPLPNANHYHSLVIALKNSNAAESIDAVTQFLMEGMEKHHVTLHNTTISTMMSLLSTTNSKDLTLPFLKAMNHSKETTEKGHPYNVYIYTSLITGFARQGDSKSAVRIFEEMKKHGIKPNQVTYAGLMEAYSKAGEFTSAIRLLTNHQRKYRTISNAMVTSLLVNALKQNNLEVAENTVKFITKKRMKQKDMDSMLLTALIWIKTKSDVDQARADFDALYEKDSHLVNTIMINHLVDGYGAKKDKENVIKSYNLHKNINNVTEESLLRSKHHLTNALFHCRDMSAAIKVFISMRKQNVPDDVTLAMVVKGLIMNNENNLAWRLFRTLQSDGVEPNLHAYTSMLKAIGHRDVAMKKKATSPPLDSNLLIEAGIQQPNLDYFNATVPSTTEALNLFRRLTGFQQPNVYTYTTLIACFAKHNISRAISIFDHMCARKIQPSTETYTAILQGCAMFRNGQMALTVFNHMCEKRIEPNSVTWRYLLKALLRSRVDKKEIDKIAQMAKRKKVECNNNPLK